MKKIRNKKDPEFDMFLRIALVGIFFVTTFPYLSQPASNYSPSYELPNILDYKWSWNELLNNNIFQTVLAIVPPDPITDLQARIENETTVWDASGATTSSFFGNTADFPKIFVQTIPSQSIPVLIDSMKMTYVAHDSIGNPDGYLQGVIIGDRTGDLDTNSKLENIYFIENSTQTYTSASGTFIFNFSGNTILDSDDNKVGIGMYLSSDNQLTGSMDLVAFGGQTGQLAGGHALMMNQQNAGACTGQVNTFERALCIDGNTHSYKDLEIYGGNARAVLNWTAPADNGDPITGYKVQITNASSIEVFNEAQGGESTASTLTRETIGANLTPYGIVGQRITFPNDVSLQSISTTLGDGISGAPFATTGLIQGVIVQGSNGTSTITRIANSTNTISSAGDISFYGSAFGQSFTDGGQLVSFGFDNIILDGGTEYIIGMEVVSSDKAWATASEVSDGLAHPNAGLGTLTELHSGTSYLWNDTAREWNADFFGYNYTEEISNTGNNYTEYTSTADFPTSDLNINAYSYLVEAINGVGNANASNFVEISPDRSDSIDTWQYREIDERGSFKPNCEFSAVSTGFNMTARSGDIGTCAMFKSFNTDQIDGSDIIVNLFTDTPASDVGARAPFVIIYDGKLDKDNMTDFVPNRGVVSGLHPILFSAILSSDPLQDQYCTPTGISLAKTCSIDIDSSEISYGLSTQPEITIMTGDFQFATTGVKRVVVHDIGISNVGSWNFTNPRIIKGIDIGNVVGGVYSAGEDDRGTVFSNSVINGTLTPDAPEVNATADIDTVIVDWNAVDFVDKYWIERGNLASVNETWNWNEFPLDSGVGGLAGTSCTPSVSSGIGISHPVSIQWADCYIWKDFNGSDVAGMDLVVKGEVVGALANGGPYTFTLYSCSSQGTRPAFSVAPLSGCFPISAMSTFTPNSGIETKTFLDITDVGNDYVRLVAQFRDLTILTTFLSFNIYSVNFTNNGEPYIYQSMAGSSLTGEVGPTAGGNYDYGYFTVPSATLSGNYTVIGNTEGINQVFQDDFSTYTSQADAYTTWKNYTSVQTNKIQVNLENDRFDFNNTAGAESTVAVDLLSETGNYVTNSLGVGDFIANFTLKRTTTDLGGLRLIHFGFTDKDETFGASDTQSFTAFTYGVCNGGCADRTWFGVATSSTLSGTLETIKNPFIGLDTFTLNKLYYFTFKKVGSTYSVYAYNCEERIASCLADSNSFVDATVIPNLRYFKITDGTAIHKWQIDDVQISLDSDVETSFIDTTQERATNYIYKVYADSGFTNGTAGYSNNVLTNDVPDQVQNLITQTETSPLRVNLQWDELSYNNGEGYPSTGLNLTSYDVYRDSGLGYTFLTSVSPTLNYYNDTTVGLGTYNYTVTGCNAIDCGDNSTASVEIISPPDTITDLQVFPITNSIYMNWTEPMGSPTYYLIERSSGDEARLGSDDLMIYHQDRGFTSTLSSGTQFAFAQNITPLIKTNVTRLDISLLHSAGACSGTGVLRGGIWSSSGATVIGSSNATISGCSLPNGIYSTSGSVSSFFFDPPIQLDAGTTYNIGANMTGTIDRDTYVLKTASDEVSGVAYTAPSDTFPYTFGSISGDFAMNIRIENFTLLANVTAPQTNFTDTGLEDGLTYFYRVRGQNDIGVAVNGSNIAYTKEPVLDNGASVVINSTSTFWYYRESDPYTGVSLPNAQDPIFDFTTISGGHILIDSGGGSATIEGYGTGYIMKSFNKTDVFGSNITIGWSGTRFGGSAGSVNLAVFDGAYNAENNPDFPLQDGLVEVGGSVLGSSTIIIGTSFVDAITTLTNASISWGSSTEDFVTVVAYLGDSNTDTYLTSEIKNITISNIGTWKFDSGNTVTNLRGNTETLYEDLWDAGYYDGGSFILNTPTNFTATAVNATVVMDWDDVGSATSYAVKRDGSEIGNPITSQFTDYFPSVNTLYNYSVIAISGGGNSSEAFQLVTTNDVPTAPANLTGAMGVVIPHLEHVFLNWDVPVDNGTGSPSTGVDIIHYQFERKQGVGAYSFLGNTTNATAVYEDETVISGANYTYKVRAINAIGYSPFSNEFSIVTTPVMTPNPPTSLTATTISGSAINTQWVAGIGGDPPTSFVLQRKHVGFTGFVTIATIPAPTIYYNDTGLLSGNTYEYRVRADNGAGSSAYSNIASATTYTVPSAPLTLNAVTFNNVQINLSWLSPSYVGGGITSYSIYRETPVGGGFVFVANVSGVTLSYSDLGLTQNTIYNYKVRATNLVGTGVFSNEDNDKTQGVPDPPINLSFTTNGISVIDVDWDSPVYTGGVPITGYSIKQAQNIDGTFVIVTPNHPDTPTNKQYTGLLQDTYYIYSIASKNIYGTGAYSANLTASTFDTIQEPENLFGVFDPIFPYNVDLTWSNPVGTPNSEITFYTIQRLNTDNITWMTIAVQGNTTSYSDFSPHDQITNTYRVKGQTIDQDGQYTLPEITTTTLIPQIGNITITNSSVAGNVLKIDFDGTVDECFPTCHLYQVGITQNGTFIENIPQIVSTPRTVTQSWSTFYTIDEPAGTLVLINGTTRFQNGAGTNSTTVGTIYATVLFDPSSNLFFTHMRNATYTGIDVQFIRQPAPWSLDCELTEGLFAPIQTFNITNVGSWTTVFGPVKSFNNAYVTCFDPLDNERQILSFTSFGLTNGTTAVVAFTNNLGDFLGVPVPFIFILFLAAIWTGRSASTGIIFMAVAIGAMGVLGYFPDPLTGDPLITGGFWALIVLITAIGTFIGKRYF